MSKLIKVRIQGTPEEMDYFIRYLQNDRQIQVSELSGLLSNVGTKKYFRRFFSLTMKLLQK